MLSLYYESIKIQYILMLYSIASKIYNIVLFVIRFASTIDII